MVSTRNKKASTTTTTSSPVIEATNSPRMEENVAFMSAQLTELVEMLKQQKVVLEEQHKVMADRRIENDDVQKEHTKSVEDKLE